MVKETRYVALLKERLAAQKEVSRKTVGNELLKIRKAELELSVAKKEEIAKRKAEKAKKDEIAKRKAEKAAKEKAAKSKGGD